jgi:signal transduction histidine kinase
MSPKQEQKILYIEDDQTNRLLVRKILEPLGFEITEAEDGLSGIERAENNQYSLILLDINLTGMNGFEIATRIKSIDHCKSTPLIALTASVMKNTKDKALISGCDGYITKPINGVKFPGQLQSYIDGKRDKLDTDQVTELMKDYTLDLVGHLEKEIRELKRANEDLRELDKMKSDFISIASHELRTPLVTIIGYVGLLLTRRLGDLPPEQEKVLSVVERNAKKLEKIVKDIFTLSLIENKIPFMEIRLNNPVNMVETVLEDYALVLAERDLDAVINKEGEIPDIECDNDKITQVISNLVNNSIKYTENGGQITITVRYPSISIIEKFGMDGADYIEFLIDDTGIGIPEDKLLKIFDKFVELADIEKHHTSDKEFMGAGTGLGLSICKGIIERHRGFIWAQNIPSGGTRLSIVIPVKADESYI